LTHQELAEVLNKLAKNIETAPIRIVGASVNVVGGQGGSVTGLRIDAIGGAPGTHTTGMRIEASNVDYPERMKELVSDLREAATAAHATLPAKAWIMGLVDRAKALGNRALDSSVASAAAEIAKAYM